MARAGCEWHGYNCPCACCNGFCDHKKAGWVRWLWRDIRRKGLWLQKMDR